MKKVVVSGTPYEQGVQEGKAFQKLIHQNVQLVREDLEKSHLNMDKYNELTRRVAHGGHPPNQRTHLLPEELSGPGVLHGPGPGQRHRRRLHLFGEES